MRKRTTDQNRRLYFLFNKLGFDDDMKKAAVEGTSNGRTDSSRELSANEAQQLIDSLSREWDKLRPKDTEAKKRAKIRQNLRRNIFKIMYDLGYINNQMTNAEKVLAIDDFTSNKTLIEKTLNALNIDELQKVIRQLQAIRRNYTQTEENKAKWN